MHNLLKSNIQLKIQETCSFCQQLELLLGIKINAVAFLFSSRITK